MKFNLRMIFIMIRIVVLSFFALILPYDDCIYLLRVLSIIFFVINIFALIKVLYINIFFIDKILNFMYNIMLYMKLYSKDNKYNRANFFIIAILCLMVFLISFISEDVFKNIVIGVFSSSMVSIFIYYFSYSYEKYKFYNDMIWNFESLKNMLESTVKEIDCYKNIDFSDRLEYIEFRVSTMNECCNSIYQISGNIIKNISIYDDLSIIAIDTLETMHTKNINNKKIFIEILDAGIDKNKIDVIKLIISFIGDLSNFHKKISDFKSLIKDIKIYTLTMQCGYENKNSMDFQEMMKEFNIKLEEYKDICEKLKDSRARCDDLRDKFMEQFK